MAKYNHNQTFIEKTKERFIKKIEPIVIPRNKLDIAHLKVKKAENLKNKLFYIAIIELVVIVILLSKLK